MGADSALLSWQAKAMTSVEELTPSSSVEEVFKVGQLAALGAETPGLQPERAAVALAARRKLLTDPAYIAPFKNGLERAIQAEFAEARDAATAVRVHPKRGEIYLALAELPSPQVIGLLGELLYDERDPWKDEPKSDYSRPRPNSFNATQTLNRIGLDGVQIIELKTTRDNEAALHQWKLWYEQVKAGTRTFRFKGDPQEYSLAGPVIEPRESKSTRPAAESKRAFEASTETANKTTSMPIWPLTIAGALLVVAIWFAMKREPAAA